jgi:hypothetical protein
MILGVMNHITNTEDTLDIYLKKQYKFIASRHMVQKSSLLAKLKAKVMGFTITN